MTKARLRMTTFRGPLRSLSGLTVLWTFTALPLPALLEGQGCLGFRGDPTSFYAQVQAEHQAQNTGVGVSVFVNFKDRFTFGGGMSSGREHPFSHGAYDWRSVFVLGLPAASNPFCVFLELEQAKHDFIQAFGMDFGSYNEQWGRLGLGYERPIGSWVGFDWSGHVAANLGISRRVMVGTLLETVEDLISPRGDVWDRRTVHPGGRLLIQARRGRYGVTGGLRTLPRMGSDLVSFLNVAFLI